MGSQISNDSNENPSSCLPFLKRKNYSDETAVVMSAAIKVTNKAVTTGDSKPARLIGNRQVNTKNGPATTSTGGGKNSSTGGQNGESADLRPENSSVTRILSNDTTVKNETGTTGNPTNESAYERYYEVNHE